MKPKVSVVMITYNHENYIKRAIEGIYLQKTDFLIELIIANDNSPDQSDSIIKNIISQSPDNVIVNYICNKKNLGANKNYLNAIAHSTGEYIANCEGDDYWTDPYKLQKQVDFLEKNNDCVLCFHKVKILKTNGEIVDDFITKIPENYQLRKTLAENNNYIHTPSVLFRNIIKDQLNATEFQKSPIGDYFLYLMITKYGKIGYINEEMAVYRYGVGVFSALDHFQHLKTNLILFTNLYSYETESETKEIFYTRFLQIVAEIQKNQTLAQNKNNILNTRRHILIEKLYKLFKK